MWWIDHWLDFSLHLYVRSPLHHNGGVRMQRMWLVENLDLCSMFLHANDGEDNIMMQYRWWVWGVDRHWDWRCVWFANTSTIKCKHVEWCNAFTMLVYTSTSNLSSGVRALLDDETSVEHCWCPLSLSIRSFVWLLYPIYNLVQPMRREDLMQFSYAFSWQPWEQCNCLGLAPPSILYINISVTWDRVLGRYGMTERASCISWGWRSVVLTRSLWICHGIWDSRFMRLASIDVRDYSRSMAAFGPESLDYGLWCRGGERTPCMAHCLAGH